MQLNFLMNKARFCKDKFCQDCETLDECNDSVRGVTKAQAERMVNIIEQWAKDHPVKTRQSEFLKMFPNAKLNDAKVIFASPCEVDESLYSQEKCRNKDCGDCHRDYWLQEVRDG